MQSVKPEQIKSARLQANLTQDQAAKVVGCAKMTWWKYEKGMHAMRPALYRLFCLHCFGKINP
jgi:transcriptional regulator with XRE-family HTH domain